MYEHITWALLLSGVCFAEDMDVNYAYQVAIGLGEIIHYRKDRIENSTEIVRALSNLVDGEDYVDVDGQIEIIPVPADEVVKRSVSGHLQARNGVARYFETSANSNCIATFLKGFEDVARKFGSALAIDNMFRNVQPRVQRYQHEEEERRRQEALRVEEERRAAEDQKAKER